MTPDEVAAILADPSSDVAADLERLALDWGSNGPPLRRLLAGYVAGADLSERTERALLPAILLMAQMRDAPSFPSLCALGASEELLVSAMGEDAAALCYASVLASTFGGDVEPLRALVETPEADEYARSDALLALAYLTRTGQLAEAETYGYLSELPGRLQPRALNFVWFGYARAVAALGFAGLASQVEAAIRGGFVDPEWMGVPEFWDDLREVQASPPLTATIWNGIEIIEDAARVLDGVDGPDAAEPLQTPARNPLRAVGRNDPCPCGSGKKYKKCCLA